MWPTEVPSQGHRHACLSKAGTRYKAAELRGCLDQVCDSDDRGTLVRTDFVCPHAVLLAEGSSLIQQLATGGRGQDLSRDARLRNGVWLCLNLPLQGRCLALSSASLHRSLGAGFTAPGMKPLLCNRPVRTTGAPSWQKRTARHINIRRRLDGPETSTLWLVPTELDFE